MPLFDFVISYEKIGGYLYGARTGLGLSTREAAKLAGMSHQHIVTIEKARQECTVGKLFQLASAYGISPMILIGHGMDVKVHSDQVKEQANALPSLKKRGSALLGELDALVYNVVEILMSTDDNEPDPWKFPQFADCFHLIVQSPPKRKTSLLRALRNDGLVVLDQLGFFGAPTVG